MADEWVPAADGLEVNRHAVARAGRRLGVTRPISLTWMTAERMEAQGYSHGACGACASSDTDHRIILRRGMSPTETAEIIAHELAHAGQAEQLGAEFAATYRADGARFEREAWRLVATVTDVETLRRCPPPSRRSPDSTPTPEATRQPGADNTSCGSQARR